MVQKPISPLPGKTILTSVQEGMTVYDRDNRRVGIVKYVQFGDGSQNDPAPKPDDFYKLPPQAQARLSQQGFIQIDCGWFAPNRYANASQVAERADDSIRLSVTTEELVSE